MKTWKKEQILTTSQKMFYISLEYGDNKANIFSYIEDKSALMLRIPDLNCFWF